MWKPSPGARQVHVVASRATLLSSLPIPLGWLQLGIAAAGRGLLPAGSLLCLQPAFSPCAVTLARGSILWCSLFSFSFLPVVGNQIFYLSSQKVDVWGSGECAVIQLNEPPVIAVISVMPTKQPAGAAGAPSTLLNRRRRLHLHAQAGVPGEGSCRAGVLLGCPPLPSAPSASVKSAAVSKLKHQCSLVGDEGDN